MASISSEDVDEVFAISEDLVQSPSHKAAHTGTIDFDGLSLRLHQDLSEGNGGQAWPAGMTLAKYLLRTKRDVLKDCSMSVTRPITQIILGRDTNILETDWSKRHIAAIYVPKNAY